MANIPVKVADRLKKKIPVFKKILADAQNRDVNESDTVTIIIDILSEVFGFDKFTEITREFVIQGTYCDLAVKVDGKVCYLLEVKAIGLGLKENHVNQATTYAAKNGVRWVVLTNGIIWKVYRVLVDGKVASEEVCSFNFLELNPKSTTEQEAIFMLCRRGVDKDLIEQYYEYRQSVNKYMITAVLKSEPVLNSIRKELRRIKDGLKVDLNEIEEILWDQIVKREVSENKATIEALNVVKKANRKVVRKLVKKRQSDEKLTIEVETKIAGVQEIFN